MSDPDIVFIDRSLPDILGIDLCREFVSRQIVSPATALIVMAPGPITRDQRVEAMRNGAWEVISLPADAEELVLRVEKYVRAKLAMDRAREDALIDAATGLYTRAGLTRRIRELGAAAERFGRPLTFVLYTTDDSVEEVEPDPALVARVADSLRGSTRRSDVLGRIGPTEFLVITPDTSPEGAENLAERLRRQSGERAAGTPVARVQVHAIEELRTNTVEPIDLLMRLVRPAGGGQGSELN